MILIRLPGSTNHKGNGVRADEPNEQPGTRYRTWIFLIIAIAAIVRFEYGRQLLLSGDEVGVGVLQSLGQWSAAKDSLPVNQVVEIDHLKKYLDFSPDASISTIIGTMRADRFHPPLYFILLHQVIRWFGSSLEVLRGFSIILSLLSLYSAWLLSGAIFNKNIGRLVSFFLLISAYCLEYGVMVRLYPLAMWLSLHSFYLVVRLVKSDGFNFRNKVVYLYILVSAAGLYTYYSFSILLACQALFAILAGKRDPRTLIVISGIYFMIFLFFVPWLYPMLEGVQSLQTKDYYFSGTYSLVAFLDHFFGIIFMPFRPWLIRYHPPLTDIATGLIALFMLSISCYGIYRYRKTRLVMAYAVSLLIYMTFFYLLDLTFRTNMLTFDRQHYFAVPGFLVLFIGCMAQIRPPRFRQWIIACFVFLSVAGMVYRFTHKSVFDGPYFFKPLLSYMHSKTAGTNDRDNLILYNIKNNRYLIPYIYHEKHNYTMYIVPGGETDGMIGMPPDIRRFSNVFLVNIQVRPRKKKRLQVESINREQVAQWLIPEGFQEEKAPFIYEEEEKLIIHHFFRSEHNPSHP